MGKKIQVAGVLLSIVVPLGIVALADSPAKWGFIVLAVLCGLLLFGVGRFIESLAK